MTERQNENSEPNNHPDIDPESDMAMSADPGQDLFESILDETRESLGKESVFSDLVGFVRNRRLPSKFSFENLEEMIRFVVNADRREKLQFDREACVEFVASSLYDDPLCRNRCEELWSGIINRISAPK